MRIVDLLKEHEAFGSYAAIARLVGQSRENVRNWERVPAEFCLMVEQHTGGAFTRYQMRPDVFGDQPAPFESAA